MSEIKSVTKEVMYSNGKKESVEGLRISVDNQQGKSLITMYPDEIVIRSEQKFFTIVG
ncbi:hypothetical protein [Enterococcus sp. N249-2]